MPEDLSSINLEKVPEGIVLVAEANFSDQPSIFSVEEAQLVAAVEKRKREFRTGRTLARSALEKLDIPPSPITIGPNREPIWPPSIAGSISHCCSLCVVAVALQTDYWGIGVDIELNEALPPDIPEMIFSHDELSMSQRFSEIKHLDTLTFSAKESVFKCLFPILRFYFDFKEVSLNFDNDKRLFTAYLPKRIADRIGTKSIIGRYQVNNCFILTLVSLKSNGESW